MPPHHSHLVAVGVGSFATSELSLAMGLFAFANKGVALHLSYGPLSQSFTHEQYKGFPAHTPTVKRLSSPYSCSEKAFQPILLQGKGFPAHTPTLKRLSSPYPYGEKAFQPKYKTLQSKGFPALKTSVKRLSSLQNGRGLQPTVGLWKFNRKTNRKINRIFIFCQSKNPWRATSKILNFVSQNQSSIEDRFCLKFNRNIEFFQQRMLWVLDVMGLGRNLTEFGFMKRFLM